MPVQITAIAPADIPSVVTCIQLAFDNDPYNNWCFDRRPGKFDAQRNFASLKAKCEWGMRNALFFVAKDPSSADPEQVLGVSMWMKPQDQDAKQTWSQYWDEYVLWFKQGLNILRYRGWGGLQVERYKVWKEEQAKCQQEVWTDPMGYYFCNIVTVLPGHQGKGIGRMLFNVVLQMADRDGRKCYLESSKDQPNTTIYGRMGFKLAKKIVCEEGGAKCALFSMVREPKEKT